MIVAPVRRGQVRRTCAYLAWLGCPATFVGQVQMQYSVRYGPIWYGPVMVGPVPAWWPGAADDDGAARWALLERGMIAYQKPQPWELEVSFCDRIDC